MTAAVIFRTDASRTIGMGHFYRCLSLARELVKLGAVVEFAMIDPDPVIAGLLGEAGVQLAPLPPSLAPGSPADAEATLGVLRRHQRPSVVVDHYGIAAQWEIAVRVAAGTVAVIDVLADRRHDCDILIDQNRMFDGSTDYDDLVPPEAQRLIGPRFALLRPDFALWRNRKRERDGTIRKVLVAFGGSDPKAHTLAGVAALEPFLGRLDRVDVVVGALNPHGEAIAAHAAGDRRFAVHTDTPHMAQLMHEADLAIGAGGVMSWERACLGLPAVALGIVANQRRNVAELVRWGAAVGAPDMAEPDAHRIEEWVRLLLSSPDLVRGMSERASRISDGLGAPRVAARLAATPLAFRAASMDDCRLVHTWRNAPSIRAVSSHPGEIDYDTHRKWFEASLADPNRRLLIAERDGVPMGVARFDVEGRRATISVFKDPEQQHAGSLIRQATQWLFDTDPSIEQVRAVVLAHNERSARAFLRAGYELAEQTYVAGRPAHSDKGQDR